MAGWFGPLARALDSYEPWHAEIAPEADYSTLERYCNDPEYRCEVNADVARNRAIAHAAIDRGMAAVNARQQARWAREEAEGEALVARMNLEGRRA